MAEISNHFLIAEIFNIDYGEIVRVNLRNIENIVWRMLQFNQNR